MENFYNYYLALDRKTFLEGYRNRSNLIGKEIGLAVFDKIKKATAIDIDDSCRLVVLYENGEKEALVSGDVSIKLNC